MLAQAARNLYARALQVRNNKAHCCDSLVHTAKSTHAQHVMLSLAPLACAGHVLQSALTHGLPACARAQIDPGNVRTLCAVATLERRCGHHKAARMHLRAALELQPDNPAALQVLPLMLCCL